MDFTGGIGAGFDRIISSLWHDFKDYADATYISETEAYASCADDTPKQTTPRVPVASSILSVRNSICLVGYHWPSLQQVKRIANDLLPGKIAIESLHIKHHDDVKDGALLVPKVMIVARHCAGKKLFDKKGKHGQLDHVYEEICRMGANVFLVYVGLPRAIYTPVRHMVFHPRLIDLVFPDQRVLRRLAENNALVTLVDGQKEFTAPQKDVLREWLLRPVDHSHHPVYKAADHLTALEKAHSVANLHYYSDNEARRRTESLRRKRKSKRKDRGPTYGYEGLTQNNLTDIEEFEESGHYKIEMKVYAGQAAQRFAIESVEE